MATLWMEYGQDLVLTGVGGLRLAFDWDETRQRLIRSFFTTPALTLPDGSVTAPEYFFSPTFGQGARVMIGQPITPNFVASATQRMNAACSSDPSIDHSQAPNINVVYNAQANPNLVTMYVTVVDVTGTKQQFGIQISA